MTKDSDSKSTQGPLSPENIREGSVKKGGVNKPPTEPPPTPPKGQGGEKE
jgi:hypothetical protein